MKPINYVGVLVKYEALKLEDKKHLKKICTLETENLTLRQCLENESKRVETFRKSYKEALNKLEDLSNDYNKLLKEKKKLRKEIKEIGGIK